MQWRRQSPAVPERKCAASPAWRSAAAAAPSPASCRRFICPKSEAAAIAATSSAVGGREGRTKAPRAAISRAGAASSASYETSSTCAGHARATRHEAQHAAIEALTQAAALDPSAGDGGGIWYELGTACFFGGELAEASRVYARGLSVAPDHPNLQKEAEHARAYAGAFTPPADAAGAVRSFDDVDFRNVEPPARIRWNPTTGVLTVSGNTTFGDATVSIDGFSIQRIEPRRAPTLQNPDIVSESFTPITSREQAPLSLQSLKAQLDMLRVPARSQAQVLQQLCESGQCNAVFTTVGLEG